MTTSTTLMQRTRPARRVRHVMCTDCNTITLHSTQPKRRQAALSAKRPLLQTRPARASPLPTPRLRTPTAPCTCLTSAAPSSPPSRARCGSTYGARIKYEYPHYSLSAGYLPYNAGNFTWMPMESASTAARACPWRLTRWTFCLQLFPTSKRQSRLATISPSTSPRMDCTYTVYTPSTRVCGCCECIASPENVLHIAQCTVYYYPLSGAGRLCHASKATRS